MHKDYKINSYHLLIWQCKTCLYKTKHMILHGFFATVIYCLKMNDYKLTL